MHVLRLLSCYLCTRVCQRLLCSSVKNIIPIYVSFPFSLHLIFFYIFRPDFWLNLLFVLNNGINVNRFLFFSSVLLYSVYNDHTCLVYVYSFYPYFLFAHLLFYIYFYCLRVMYK